MDHLKDVKTGDILLASRGRDSTEWFETVNRVTPTQVICENARYRRSDGRRIGDSGFYCTYASVPAPGEIEAIKEQREAKQTIKDIKSLLETERFQWSPERLARVKEMIELSIAKPS